MIGLFTVTTTVHEYSEAKNVPFKWFYHGMRKTRRPYGRLIENYDPLDEGARYAEGCVDELFSGIEAATLKDYLDREHGHDGSTIIEPAELPIAFNQMGMGARAVGGGDSFYMLDGEANYSLPFSVWGYFNLVGCEMLDGTGTYHHRLLLLQPGTGSLRRQTNAEAAAFSVGLD